MNDKLVTIQSLLAKAESTTFAPEAEALLAKAAELMARYSIDEALLERSPGARRSEPVAVEVSIEDPYALRKVGLLAAVAKPNGVRVVRLPSRQGTRCWLGGFDCDVRATQALFATLLVLGCTQLLAERRLYPREHGRSFATSFWTGFADRIGSRLRAAAKTAADDASASAGKGVALVLADRAAAVKTFTNATFPHLRSTRVQLTSDAGYQAGQRAGDRAILNPAAGPGHRQALAG